MFRPFQMRPLSLVVLLLCSQLLGYEVKVHVVDETGASVAGAEVKVVFGSYNSEDVVRGMSNSDGWCRAAGRGDHSVMVKVAKPNYYNAQLERLSSAKDHDVEVVLPRVVSPVSLYALRNVRLKFPVQGEWIGFDFEAADWVAPHGAGKSADICFRFRNEFKGWNDRIKNQEDMERAIAVSKEGCAVKKIEWSMDLFRTSYGKWDGLLEVSFPGQKEGLVEAAKFWSYSQLKMPHSAPTEGYLPTWRFEGKSYKFRDYRQDVGYFLRTRVRLDKGGDVVAAHYTKIMGDFLVANTVGQVTFSYYFNPTPNDRNLEFDPKKNLFPKGKPGANVYDP